MTMVLKKFRSVEDMEGPPRLVPLAAENLRIACELTELAFGLHPWAFEPGVRKFRSFDEALVARSKRDVTQARKRPQRE